MRVQNLASKQVRVPPAAPIFKNFIKCCCERKTMAFNILLAAAAVVGGFILLRILLGSRSSYSSRHGAVRRAESGLLKVDRLETEVNKLQAFIRAAPNDRRRELAAKLLERKLKSKEKLKKMAERNAKRS